MVGCPILIVDDDAPLRSLLQQTLTSGGYAAEAVASGDSAREFLYQHPLCPLVFSDVMMPGMNGLTLLSHIKAEHTAVPVVLLSAQQDGTVILEGFRRGALDYIFKPLRRAELLATTARALEHGRWLRLNHAYRANLEVLIEERTSRLRQAAAALERSYDITLEAMGDALDMRDHETEGHSRRVTAYTLAIARAHGVSGEALKTIARGAYLHDLGKIAIPDSILLKPGRLTDEEMAVMRLHCARGYELVRKIPSLEDAAEIVHAHQEKFDGTGYPRGLAAEQIPLGARLFAVADTLDAITSDRPYRAGRSVAEASAEIVRCSGTQFDPEIVATFVSLPLDTWHGIRASVGKHSATADLLRG